MSGRLAKSGRKKERNDRREKTSQNNPHPHLLLAQWALALLLSKLDAKALKIFPEPSPHRTLGWSGGAKVMGKLPVQERPTISMTVGQGPITLAIGAGGGCLGIFTFPILSLLFLPLSGRRPDID